MGFEREVIGGLVEPGQAPPVEWDKTRPWHDLRGDTRLGNDLAAFANDLDEIGIVNAQVPGIGGVHLDVGFRVALVKYLDLARARSGMPVVLDAARREDDGVGGVRGLGGTLIR